MRVLHTINRLDASDGGPTRSVPSLAQAQAENGADVRVWAAKGYSIPMEEYPRVQFFSGQIDGTETVEWEADVVHDHGIWLRSNHTSAAFAKRRKIPRIVSPRGMLKKWSLNHRRYRKQIAWALYQRRDLNEAAGLHATCQQEAAEFRELGLKMPVIEVPNGVTAPFQPIQAFGKSNQGEQGVRREVLFLSRLHRVKGIHNLLEAWAKQPKEDWLLRIVGPDDDGYGQSLLSTIHRLGIKERVKIEPAVHSEEKWDLLRKADVFVLPSFTENFGIVVAEALSAGTPVITTTGTPWADLVTHKCGWHVAPTVDGLTAALSSAMSCSEAELQRMGLLGRAWMQKDFQWAAIAERMLNAYSGLMNEALPIRRVAEERVASKAA